MSRPSNISERTIRPNDVPGRLLNMALLNLGSDDPNLRRSSYNLLYALSRVFNFDVGKQLLDTKGKKKSSITSLNEYSYFLVFYIQIFAFQQIALSSLLVLAKRLQSLNLV